MNNGRRKHRTPQTSTRRKSAPVVVVRPHPDAWAAALKLVGGDASRLRAQPDGSVVTRSLPKRDANVGRY